MCRKKVYCVHYKNIPELLVTDVPECRHISIDDIKRSGFWPHDDYKYELVELSLESSPELLHRLQKPGLYIVSLTYDRLQELILQAIERITYRL